MENLPALNLKNLDKSQWKTYRFDEIAKNISERVDPNNTDLEVYVGLEHIDSESIHLTRSGTPDDVDGQKLRFYPGDVIFGRRRAYQRKAALATTHGFCSAHALVLRANPEVIDPQLFPFFMHSDAFMHRAVDISVGSLSPTINWGTLKHQTFNIPPREQQEQLYELLNAADQTHQKYLMVYESLSYTKISYFKRFLDSYKNNQKISLGDVCRPRQWKTIPQEKFIESGYPVYGANGIIGFYNEFNHEDPVIAITCRGASCGNIHITPAKCYVTGNAMCLDDLNTEIFDTKFLYYVLANTNLESIISGSAQPQIIKEDVERFKVHKLNRTEQNKVCSEMHEIENSIEFTNSYIEKLDGLKKNLINKIF